MKFQGRSEFGWGASGGGYANPRSGIVIHYDSANQGLARKAHSACVTYWKNTRKFHMNTRGWSDIGYTAAACVHGYVMEGRGLNKEQAAQPGGNSTWYSITLMSGPDEDPTDAQIQAVREFRKWVMSKGVAGAVRGHRDFIATSCPGDRLYRLVKNGTFGQAPSEEDDMPSPQDLWMWDGIPAPKTSSTKDSNTHWQPANVMRETYDRTVEIKGMLAAQQATIDKLVDALGAGQGVDLEALKGEIREAIESVRVRLDVEDSGAGAGS